MTAIKISRRAGLMAALAGAAGLSEVVRATQSERSALEDKNLKTVLEWWRLWETDPPSVDSVAAMMADDCIVFIGNGKGETRAEGKEAVTAVFRQFGELRFKNEITESFTSGSIVVTRFRSASWKKGEMPTSPSGSFVAVFVLQQGKISKWIDANNADAS